MGRIRTVRDVIKEVAPRIERILNRHRQVLGPGKEFVVKVRTRAVKISQVVHSPSPAPLNAKDWEKILNGRRWTHKYRMAFTVIKENGNKPTSREKFEEKGIDFYPHSSDRERLNRMFRASGLPYFIKNANYGHPAEVYIVRR